MAKRGRVFKTFSTLPLLCFLLSVLPVWADGFNSLPAIERLDNRDTIFRQYLQDVEASRRSLFNPRNTPEKLAELITIYSYTPSSEDDLIGLAARCSVPYGSLASINRISHPDELNAGKPLLLPSMAGLFIPMNPQTDLEMLLASSRDSGIILSIGGEKFRFLPGVDLNPTERVFFFNKSFRFPLPAFRITSPFGSRVNPVTGKQGMHNGIDLAAPTGTQVFAVREGRVSSVGEDPILGLYVMITHNDNWVSVYGHLSRIETFLNQELRSGSLIGRVGSTGQSTGPHLHFELRQDGRARDPAGLLRLDRL